MRTRQWALSLVLLVAWSLGATAGGFSHTTAHAAAAPPPDKADAFVLPRRTAQPLVTAPPYTQSLYENTTYWQTLQTQGCNAAHKTASGVIVLDWGQIDANGGVWGTYDFGGVHISNDDILHATANFIQGIWNCHTSATNFAVAIGTSNYGSCYCSSWYTAGQKWGQLVLDVQSFVVNNGMSAQIGVYGADDIEIGWNSYTNSKAFVDGYNSITHRVFFDYGDDPGGTNPAPWTAYQVWYVAYGAPANYPLPEIYYNADATEDWEPLSIWACNNEGGPIKFKGTMTEYPTGNSPATGYLDMYNAINSNSCTRTVLSYLIFSTNINYA